MSLSSILQKIQSKGQIRNPPPRPTPKPPTATALKPTYPSSSSSNERTVDPVVARLKAARKAEKEAKEREMRAKKGSAPKKETSHSRTSKTTSAASSGTRGTINRNKNASTQPLAPQKSERKPKMSFSELMKKASSIDQSKMSISIKPKTKTPEAQPRRKTPERDERRARTTSPRTQGRQEQKPESTIVRSNGGNSKHLKDVRSSQPERKAIAPRQPIPIRQPSSKLQSKLKSKKADKSQSGYDDEADEDEDDDLDSFIASDEEEQVSEEHDYDRDEIWSIFNRGRKRSYYEQYDDEDSDDMEATGAEILEEEALSKRIALKDDQRELLEEQRRAKLKEARKKAKR
ncbi:SPT2 chromatin family protein [Clavispora lusitaniae]|uniref:SPT2 chromatin family protein n=1 Tax=Clavispora lusitaniae TaxID=36911 RepID=UPI00202C8FC6|nr:SPT2 chromatin family protein [Clavispora lusitaniae]